MDQLGDTSMTSIVVVQFSELLQTRSDVRYNLTCATITPGEAVVKSGFIGAGYTPMFLLLISTIRSSSTSTL